MIYKPTEYWLTRGKNYKTRFRYSKMFEMQEETILNCLKSIPNIQSVLEVGCGFGRITKLLLQQFPHIKEYHAFDISPHQIQNSIIKYEQDNRLKLSVNDIKSFPLGKKYDLVLAVEVLMHVLPQDLNAVFNRMLSLSRRNVVHVDWYDPISEDIETERQEWNFNHDYYKLYSKYPDTIMVYRFDVPVIPQSLFSIILKSQ